MDLLSHYSNRPELLTNLTVTQQRLRTKADKSDQKRCSVGSDAGQPPERRRVVDRLTAQAIDALIASYQAGSSYRDLAERYGLGTTTIKRLIREHGARRKDQGRAA